jgi:hypothetical protein
VNPLFFDNVQPAVNHAPVVVNMRPRPSFARIEMNVGENCAPQETFRPERVEDADLDVLSVRWSLLLQAKDFADGVSQALLDYEIEPLESPVEGSFYVFPEFQVDRTTVLQRLRGDLDVQTPPFDDDDPVIDGQLLELRISDGGFAPGSDEAREQAGFFYLSWPIRLLDLPEPCRAGGT